MGQSTLELHEAVLAIVREDVRRARTKARQSSRLMRVQDGSVPAVAAVSAAGTRPRQSCDICALATLRNVSFVPDVFAEERARRYVWRRSLICWRQMTVPGVGPPATATFKSALDNPTRIAKVGRSTVWAHTKEVSVRAKGHYRRDHAGRR